MEKIIQISEFEGRPGHSKVAGFEVITTDQIVQLYIDDEQDCCESWGYFWCNENPQDFVGAELRSVAITDTALNEAQMKANELNPNDKWFEGGIMFVNIETSIGTLQFVAYNIHNGYYGHQATVKCTQLTHSEVL